MKIDNLETLLKPFTDSLGVKVEIAQELNPTLSSEGMRFKMRIPQIVQQSVHDTEEKLLTYASATQVVHDIVKQLESMQRACFERMWHHLQTHDTTGKVQSLQKIAKLAVELAMQHISPNREEYKCLEHYLAYIKDVERRLDEKYGKKDC